MTKTWVIADLHFGHANILKFKNSDGDLIRPGFTDVDHMNWTIINNWNNLVSEKDKVYVLGDLAINRRYIPLIGNCLGRKVLVKGNHDIFRLKDYLPYFEDVVSCMTSPHQYILSHVPVHPLSLGRWKVNIHGHTHNNKVLIEGTTKVDKRYYSVSVEQTDMKPKSLDDILKELEI